MEAFSLIADLGFSIAAVIGGGFFIILLLKYILDSVVSRAVGLNGMIGALDNRVKTINNEIVRLDALICHALGVKPDTRRLLDNDMIRLDQKIHTIIEIQNQQMDPFEAANKKRMEVRQAELDYNQDKEITANKKEIAKLKK